jgi:hypothetical protein
LTLRQFVPRPEEYESAVAKRFSGWAVPVYWNIVGTMPAFKWGTILFCSSKKTVAVDDKN